jgi:DNA polymerase/3'-5' exonuclease PolX
MDMDERRVPLAEALALAEDLLAIVRPFCERAEIAGSIRRRRPTVKDVEIVAVQRVRRTEETDIFGAKTLTEEIPELWERLDAMHKEKAIIYTKGGGEIYRQFFYNGMKVDLFTCVPGNWGYIFLLRTGSDAFNKGAVVRLPELGYHGVDGWIVRDIDRKKMETPEESDVFRLLGMAPVEPPAREAW